MALFVAFAQRIGLTGKLAETLQAEKLVLMTNTVGVLDKDGNLLTGLSASEIDALFADGTIHELRIRTRGTG